MIDRLLREHRAMEALVDRLRAALQPATPDVDELKAARWELAKTMMSHLAFEDRHLYLPLERHPDTAVAAVALAFKAHVTNTQIEYEAYTQRWTGVAMAADWRGFCVACAHQLDVLVDRIKREEADLFPLIPRLADVATAVTRTERNWAQAAWQVRSALGGG